MTDANSGRAPSFLDRALKIPRTAEPTPPKKVPTSELASATVVKYCNAAADHLEQVIAEVQDKVAKFAEDGQQTANNLRQIGEIERERTAAFYSTVKGAIDAMTAARAAFDDYMATPRKTTEHAREDTGVLNAVTKALEAQHPLISSSLDGDGAKQLQ